MRRQIVNRLNFILLVLIAVLACWGCQQLALGNSQWVWVTSGLDRVERKEVRRGVANEIQLYSARGEYEGFQIVVKAASKGLSNVNVMVSDLVNSKGKVIDQSNLTLYREHYVNVTHSSPTGIGDKNPPLGAGWYADALIPFINADTGQDILSPQLDAVPFNVPSGENQPIWVDIYIPPETSPGEYQGNYTVTSDRGTTTGTINLQVWNFTLPLQPSLDSSFAFWEEENTPARKVLLQHKLMPNRLAPEDQEKAIAEWGLKSSRLPFWSGADVKTCTMKPAPSVAEIKEVAATYDSRIQLHARFADEIDRCENLIESVKQWARNFHQAGIDTAIAMTPTPALYDDGTGRSSVDIWIVLPKMYNAQPERVREVLANGDRVWFYNALVQDDYSPKWQIDYAPINFRIPHSFINYSLGLTGVLYWQVDFWSDNPWYDVMSYTEDDNYFPGEGMLVYPGEEVGMTGVVPSIRLKWIRDGVEDYEYLKLLENMGQKDIAKEFSKKVGQNWSQWTKDPKLLEEIRIELGRKIDEG